MLARILNLIQAHKPPLRARPPRNASLRFLHLPLAPALINRQSELGVDQLQPVFPPGVFLLERVHARQPEVHGIGVREVFEEGEELDDVVLGNDLQADCAGGPLFVDGDDHAPAGDGERGGDSIELDFEAGHGELEGVQVFERVECETPDGGGVGQRAEEFCERVGHAGVGAAAVHRDGHVLLRVAEERDVCGAVGGEADEDLAGA